MKFFPLVLALALAAGLGGCDTFEHRTRQKASYFATLSPQQQEKLKRGVIEIGNPADMVYLALGEPDEKTEIATAAGRETEWIYYSYHREYEGHLQAGFHRLMIFDPATKRYSFYLEPVYHDVYDERVEENIRVKFKDNKVVEIEQPKPAKP